jgi:nucleotide-binding universal stress UspA family protein
MKVLIGIDDSPHSNAALQLVKTMSWPTGTRFIVLSAVPLPMLAYATADMGGVAVMDTVEKDQIKIHEELAARVERDLKDAGFATTGRVERGDPREVIVEVAAKERADLVIVGSHGRTGLRKLLMGSVASHVVTHAPCSVLVVKDGQR